MSTAIDRLPSIFALLLFRAVPFAAFLMLSKDFRARSKLLVAAAFAFTSSIVIRAGAPLDEVLIRAPIALLYFALGASLVHRLASWFAVGRMTRGAVLGTVALWFVLTPALLVPSAVIVPTIAVGWELMLSAYSYCLDTAATSERPTLSQCVFFIVINPTVVYLERGRRVSNPRLDSRALIRVALGILTMLGRDLITLPLVLSPFLQPIALSNVVDFATYARFAATNGLQGVGLYLAHSGLASVQIGMMRVCGHEVPERYKRPFLANNPEEFWRRWNTWIGSWARRYVYFPVGAALRRRRFTSPRLIPLSAALSTFLVIGLLHDFASYVACLHDREAGSVAPLAMTSLFALLGLGFVAFAVLRRLPGRRAIANRTFRSLPLAPIAMALAFHHFNILMVSIVVAHPSGLAQTQVSRSFFSHIDSPSIP